MSYPSWHGWPPSGEDLSPGRIRRSTISRAQGGTLYPLLNRFESAGLVQAEWRPGDGGPGRKYYTLTDAGSRELTDGADQWIAFAAVTTRLVVPQPAMTISPSTPAGPGAGEADPS